MKFVSSEGYLVTISSSAGGSTSPNGTFEVEKEGFVDLNAIPNNGYAFDSWQIINGKVEFSDPRDAYSEYAQICVYSDCTIQALFVSSLTNNPISITSAINTGRNALDITITSKYALKSAVTAYLSGQGEYVYNYNPDDGSDSQDQWNVRSEAVTLTSGKSSWTFTLYPTMNSGISGVMSVTGEFFLNISKISDQTYQYTVGKSSCTITRK